ncbi:hypothetical protein Tco_1103583 [Tanacetum coccineum]
MSSISSLPPFMLRGVVDWSATVSSLDVALSAFLLPDTCANGFVAVEGESLTSVYESPSYSQSPQPYYVTHHLSVIDYEDNYQREIQGDAQEDTLTTAMMLLARAITQRYSTPTNNRLRTLSNTRIQAVIQDGHVDI